MTVIKSILIALFLVPITGFAQVKAKPSQEEMALWLEKALKKIESGSFSIKFDAIAKRVKDPLDIFKLPAYKVFRGGYYYCDNDKMELNMGGIKALSDGKLMVMIDEIEHQFIIDSATTKGVSENVPLEDIIKTMGPGFSDDLKMEYKGVQKVKGKDCHVISATMKITESSQSSLYYLTVKSGEIILMAEFSENLYDVYWIASIGDAPLKYSYNIYLPKKEVKSFHGYEVVDLRF